QRSAFAISLRLGTQLNRNSKNAEVIDTGGDDTWIAQYERAAIAKRKQADLFISIHCSAASSSSDYGTEPYVMGLHKTEANLDLAKRENNVILLEDNYKKSYKGFDPNSPLAHIMLANYQSAYLSQSMDFAS